MFAATQESLETPGITKKRSQPYHQTSYSVDRVKFWAAFHVEVPRRTPAETKEGEQRIEYNPEMTRLCLYGVVLQAAGDAAPHGRFLSLGGAPKHDPMHQVAGKPRWTMIHYVTSSPVHWPRQERLLSSFTRYLACDPRLHAREACRHRQQLGTTRIYCVLRTKVRQQIKLQRVSPTAACFACFLRNYVPQCLLRRPTNAGDWKSPLFCLATTATNELERTLAFSWSVPPQSNCA